MTSSAGSGSDLPERADDSALITLLRRLTVESDRFAELFGQAHGLHRTDLNALAIIMDATLAGRSLRPGELSEELGLSNSATTALLDRLQDAGHLHRDRSEHDRRVVELRMHQQALDLGREFFAPLGQRMSHAWAGLSEGQRATVAQFLRASIDATIQTRRDIDKQATADSDRES